MEHTKFCQSCGMPLTSHEAYGTLGSGEKSGDCCAHCYQDGAFTWDCTMDEMIEFCLRLELAAHPFAGQGCRPGRACGSSSSH